MSNITETEIKRKYHNKKHDKKLQIKMQVPNLYLFVGKNGSCIFKFRLFVDGSASWARIGKYPAISVAKAIEEACRTQSMRDNGINPNKQKKAELKKSIKLNQLLDNYQAINNKVNKLASSTMKYQSYMFNIIIDKIGDYKVKDITSEIIYTKLIKNYVDNDKLAMANRFRTKLKQVFDYAIKHEIIEKNPTNLLDTYYTPKVAQDRNLYLTESDLKSFMNCLYNDEYLPNLIKYYIHLLVILGVRKSELVSATWDMIDFDNAVFSNYQIKTNKTNKIPLSEQAIKLLKRIQSISIGDSYIVVNRVTYGKNKLVGHNYFNQILDSLNFNISRDRALKISPHDFRRALSTLANESELFAPIDIEMALGHETRSGTERHYNNITTYLTRKRAVFDWIANKVDSLLDDKDIYNLMVFL